MFHYNPVIAPSYILNQIELEAKEYVIKNSITNLMNQVSCTSDATNVLEYSSQGRVLLILVSKQNSKPSSWPIYHNKNYKKWIRNEKVMVPQSKGGQKFKKTIEHYKGQF